MPTLIIETGAIVPNANSFVSLAEIVTYCDGRGYTWNPADDNAGIRAAIRAGDYLKNLFRTIWRGSMITATQAMPWPRTGASYYRGPDIPSDLIPPCVKDAQCELAYRSLAGTNLQPDLARGGRVKVRKVDVVEQEFFPDAPSETVIQAVMGILAPVIINGNMVFPVPYKSEPVDVSPFLPGQFNNPPLQWPTGQVESTSGQVTTPGGTPYPGSN